MCMQLKKHCSKLTVVELSLSRKIKWSLPLASHLDSDWRQITPRTLAIVPNYGKSWMGVTFDVMRPFGFLQRSACSQIVVDVDVCCDGLRLCRLVSTDCAWTVQAFLEINSIRPTWQKNEKTFERSRQTLSIRNTKSRAKIVHFSVYENFILLNL